MPMMTNALLKCARPAQVRQTRIASSGIIVSASSRTGGAIGLKLRAHDVRLGSFLSIWGACRNALWLSLSTSREARSSNDDGSARSLLCSKLALMSLDSRPKSLGMAAILLQLASRVSRDAKRPNPRGIAFSTFDLMSTTRSCFRPLKGKRSGNFDRLLREISVCRAFSVARAQVGWSEYHFETH